MSHTPGPWDYRPMKWDDWGWVRARMGGEIVARAGGFAPREEQDRHRSAGTDPYEANARLITAAPDLYEAAKHAVMEWHLHGQLTDSCRVLEAAIKKAEAKA
jgi:hypothetical protein